MTEFEIIAKFFAPLAQEEPGAFGLTDDAAVIRVSDGTELVVSVDSVVAGVHFPDDEAPSFIARKALRISLSDLAAMGASPRGYLVGLVGAKELDQEWFRRFAEGLSVDQSIFRCPLLGGDTVAKRGPLTVSMTVFGEVPQAAELRRSGAKVGDRIFISGSLGEAALGLRVHQGAISEVDEAVRAHLLDRYRLPEPRLQLGTQLRGLANAAIDVSDGLIADLGHLCAASGVGSIVRTESLPLSPAVRTLIAADSSTLPVALTGGDDYEILFTVPGESLAAVSGLAARLNLALTEIGEIVAGKGVLAMDASDLPLELKVTGYQHY